MNRKETRMKKWARVRAQIGIDNMNHMFENFDDFWYIKTHQEEIKKEKGCKH